MDKARLQKITDQILGGISSRLVLSLIEKIGIFAIIIILIFNEVKEGSRDIVNIMAGGILGAYLVGQRYWFERSKDYSDEKKMERVRDLQYSIESSEAGTNADAAKSAEVDTAIRIAEKLSNENKELRRIIMEYEDQANKTTPQP